MKIRFNHKELKIMSQEKREKRCDIKQMIL